jgi:hypothetical protein
VEIVVRASGETGRRAGLRIQWGNPWEFESPLAHQINPIKALCVLSNGTRNVAEGAVVLDFVRFVLDRVEPRRDTSEGGALVLTLDDVVALINGIGDVARDRFGHFPRRAGVL